MNGEVFRGGLEPAIAALLNALVERIDNIPFAARSRPLTFLLNAENWPEFFVIEQPGERAVAWGWVGTLAKQPGITLELDRQKRVLDLDIWERRPRLIVTADAEEFLRQATGRPPRDRSWITEWRQAVRGRFGDSELAARLISRPITILQRPAEDILQRFVAIAALPGSNLMLHEVASRQFWGLSKILNGQQEAIAMLLEQPACPFPDKPVQLLVAPLTENLDAPILFIENAATFESLASRRLPLAQGFLLVFASGYRATARRIRSREGSSVYFSPLAVESGIAAQRRFLDWLYSPDSERPVYFWGDLDYAGMDILKELRVVFPAARAWQAGYGALLERLIAGESHAPDEARKSGQIDPARTGCDYADAVLLPALREHGRFVDQESL